MSTIASKWPAFYQKSSTKHTKYFDRWTSGKKLVLHQNRSEREYLHVQVTTQVLWKYLSKTKLTAANDWRTASQKVKISWRPWPVLQLRTTINRLYYLKMEFDINPRWLVIAKFRIMNNGIIGEDFAQKQVINPWNIQLQASTNIRNIVCHSRKSLI